jgi:hypothetical protein
LALAGNTSCHSVTNIISNPIVFGPLHWSTQLSGQTIGIADLNKVCTLI